MSLITEKATGSISKCRRSCGGLMHGLTGPGPRPRGLSECGGPRTCVEVEGIHTRIVAHLLPLLFPWSSTICSFSPPEVLLPGQAGSWSQAEVRAAQGAWTTVGSLGPPICPGQGTRMPKSSPWPVPAPWPMPPRAGRWSRAPRSSPGMLGAQNVLCPGPQYILIQL